MSPRSERRDAQAQLTRVCLREHPTSSWAAQRMSLTSHSLPGSPRLPEPRVQSWLRDGDRGPLALRGPGLLLPSDLPTSHGCSQPGPLAREFHPSCEHPPGKAKQKTPATFGEEAAYPRPVFPKRGGRKAAVLARSSSSKSSGRGSKPPPWPAPGQGREGAAPPAGAAGGTSGTRSRSRFRHGSASPVPAPGPPRPGSPGHRRPSGTCPGPSSPVP